MSAATNRLELELLDHFFSNGNTPAAYTPDTLFLALATAVSDAEAGSFTEVTGGSYARQALAGKFGTVASSGAISNDANIQFPTATGDYGTVTHIVIMDALTSGNALIVQQLASPKVVETGDTFVVNSGNLTVSLA